MVSQNKVCVIEGIRFRRMNCLQLGNRTEMDQLDHAMRRNKRNGQPDEGVCDI